MSFEVKKILRNEWAEVAPAQFLSVFGGRLQDGLDRSSFALEVSRDGHQLGFVTCIELDSETLYWQWGGVVDGAKKTLSVVGAYLSLIHKAKDIGFKRIATRIENTNTSMLHMAMKCGFLIVGTYVFKGVIFLELVNEFGS